MEKKRLGESLVEEDVITVRQLEYALSLQVKNVNLEKLGQILVRLKCIDEDTLVEFLGKQYGAPGISLHNADIDENAAYMIPKNVAEKYNVIPVGFKPQGMRKKLIVAMSDPFNLEIIDTLAFITGHAIEPVFAREEDLRWVVRYYYSKRVSLP